MEIWRLIKSYLEGCFYDWHRGPPALQRHWRPSCSSGQEVFPHQHQERYWSHRQVGAKPWKQSAHKKTNKQWKLKTKSPKQSTVLLLESINYKWSQQRIRAVLFVAWTTCSLCKCSKDTFQFCVEFNQDSRSTAHATGGRCHTFSNGSLSSTWDGADQGRKVQLLQLIQAERSRGQRGSFWSTCLQQHLCLIFRVPTAEEIQDMLDGLCLLAVHTYFLEEVLGKKIV